RAQVIADAYPAQPFEAVVSFIAPSVDPQRGTVDVRLQADPAPDFLLEGMTVSINILTDRRQQALVIPNDALHNPTGDSAFVWRVEEGKAQRAAIELGWRGLVLSEVLAGLDAGDRVLLAGSYSEGQRVRT